MIYYTYHSYVSALYLECTHDDSAPIHEQMLHETHHGPHSVRIDVPPQNTDRELRKILHKFQTRTMSLKTR